MVCSDHNPLGLQFPQGLWPPSLLDTCVKVGKWMGRRARWASRAKKKPTIMFITLNLFLLLLYFIIKYGDRWNLGLLSWHFLSRERNVQAGLSLEGEEQQQAEERTERNLKYLPQILLPFTLTGGRLPPISLLSTNQIPTPCSTFFPPVRATNLKYLHFS